MAHYDLLLGNGYLSGLGPCLIAFLLVAHYDLLLGNGYLSGLGPCLIAFLLVAHYDLLLGNGCLSGLGPCLVAFSFHFGLVGLHFLAFWPLGLPSIPCILTLWAFISLHFGLVGLHFLAFWPCGPSFPFILAFSGSASGVPPPQVAKTGPFAQRPYNGFISAVTGSILPFLALWAFISLHFGLVGLHFLAFWPCRPSFPCILGLWAFISFHFGLFGVGFWGPAPTSCQKWPVCPTSLQWIYQRRDRLHFAVF